jgi:hypothetical protein
MAKLPGLGIGSWALDIQPPAIVGDGMARMNIISNNIAFIESLLRHSFPNAEISITPSRTDGKKFKVESETQSMFLCVSNEYLSDQPDSRIRADYEGLRLAQVLLASPGQYFLLSKHGLERLPSDIAAS